LSEPQERAKSCIRASRDFKVRAIASYSFSFPFPFAPSAVVLRPSLPRPAKMLTMLLLVAVVVAVVVVAAMIQGC
jgi:hypothetical protein